MSAAQLVIINTDGSIDVRTPDPATLEHGCPSFESIKSALRIPEHGLLELLRITYNKKNAWMLVDEEGLLHESPFNLRASDIAGQRLVGNVAIWTGDIE